MSVTPDRTSVSLSAGTAQEIADTYLIDYVGDLLTTGTPRLEAGRWVFPIVLSTARRGPLGEVGTIVVDAESGEVLFSEGDRARVKSSARFLLDD